jgi:NADPH-dependent glutamate synthase beta subunit-like oxidoreductase/NAD-dependent dihydropyrimidine dehydrogenase PreA subunit
MTDNHGILIVGATPRGLQAALTLARCGREVVLVHGKKEIDEPPPHWGDQARRWSRHMGLQAAHHPGIEILTETEAAEIKGEGGRTAVRLVRRPRWVDPDRCVDCEKCLTSCPVDLQEGRKPIFRLRAPTSMAIDKREKAPCRSACPLDMNPQGYVALTAHGRFDEAYGLVLEKNPLPGICGRVCHHPCESACRRREIEDPVAICALKRFLADRARGKKGKRDKVPPAEGPRVAIIGSGPAGLTAAHDLTVAGFRPVLIEAKHKPGGLLWQGIAPYRLPREIIEEEIEEILALGVDLRLNAPVRSWRDIENLRAEGFGAILLATGASKDLLMGVPGEDLGNIHGCVSFLNRLWRGEDFPFLGRVAVVGGGNAAVEAARACIRSGADSVTLLYRRTRREMPADPQEIEQALEEGVRLRSLTVPVAFEGRGDQLARIRCVKMRPGAPDGSGRRRPVPVEGSDFFLKADTAIVSIGQEATPSWVDGGDLRIDPSGTIEIREGGETNVPGIYSAGDAVSGPGTVVEAMASGRRAARTIIRDLKPGEGSVKEIRYPDPPRESHDPVPKGIPKQPRIPVPHREIPERKRDLEEVMGPFSPQEAMEEASRCLNCGGCMECLCCETSCDLEVIRHAGGAEERTLSFEQVILADEEQIPRGPESARWILVGGKRRDSRAKAMVLARAAAMEALAITSPAKGRPVAGRALAGRDSGVGVFICSCNGTLNERGQLNGMIGPLEETPRVARVEILTSACHPELGRRIEEVIEEEGLTGALIASCACCTLDFVCESCTDQRIRLKKRLFKEAGYRPEELSLVNIKETCLLPFRGEEKRAADMALRLIRGGMRQFMDRERRTPRKAGPAPRALVLGATGAGISAARGLNGQVGSVVLVEGRGMSGKVEEELRGEGITPVLGVRPLLLLGQRGSFTLIVEREPSRDRKKGPEDSIRKRAIRSPAPGGLDLDGDPRYERIEGGIIILGSRAFRDTPYQRDPFGRRGVIRGPGASGTLETAIPGVYMAAWPQARKIPEETLGKAGAVEALEGSLERYGPDFPAAQVDPELCRGCGSCADVCPEGAVRLEETTRGVASSWVEAGFCTACGNCVAECPTGAIRLPGSGQGYFEKVIDAYTG